MKTIPDFFLIPFCFLLYAEKQAVSQNIGVGTDPGAKLEIDRIEYRHHAMISAGNQHHGQELFVSEQFACATCHTVDGSNTKVGPDLSAIGDKIGRGDIIDSILQPSATIADGFNITWMKKKDGKEFTGILKNATDEWIEFREAGKELVRIPTRDILNQQTIEMSLMPEGLHLGMSKQDLADLVDYLVSLKRPENVKMFHKGTPNVIPEISRPISLTPFHSEHHKFDRPVWFGQIPGESNAFLVLEHAVGKIWLLEKSSKGINKSLFLDLGEQISKGGARGLMGLAFHPKFRENRRYFLSLHITEKRKHIALTVERKTSPNYKKDSGTASRTVLRWNATTSSHTGGGLEFGPDGYLYVGMGDTGPHEDPNGHAQNLALLKGKMLRIDVDHWDDGKIYSIPPDNPFVGNPSICPEIWACGLREPWRFSFDSLTGDLWVGDVGQDRYEEVTIVRRGENHGWNVWEGFERFSNQYRTDGSKYINPIFAYARKDGVSIIGGHVYRKNTNSPYYGVYIFGDHQSRQIWGLTQKNRILNKIMKIGMAPQKIVSFAISENGDLYLVGYEGTIYQLDFEQSGFSFHP